MKSSLFAALGKNPAASLRVFFVTPLENLRGWSEVALKMIPLLLCALGLALCYRSNVWNIGAEGQYILGALFAGWVAMQAGPDTSRLIVLPILLAGGIGLVALLTFWCCFTFSVGLMQALGLNL